MQPTPCSQTRQSSARLFISYPGSNTLRSCLLVNPALRDSTYNSLCVSASYLQECPETWAHRVACACSAEVLPTRSEITPTMMSAASHTHLSLVARRRFQRQTPPVAENAGAFAQRSGRRNAWQRTATPAPPDRHWRQWAAMRAPLARRRCQRTATQHRRRSASPTRRRHRRSSQTAHDS